MKENDDALSQREKIKLIPLDITSVDDTLEISARNTVHSGLAARIAAFFDFAKSGVRVIQHPFAGGIGGRDCVHVSSSRPSYAPRNALTQKGHRYA